METNNKNKKIEELTDEQLKQVAGGAAVPPFGCRTMSTTTGECEECMKGWTFKKSSSGVQECVPPGM